MNVHCGWTHTYSTIYMFSHLKHGNLIPFWVVIWHFPPWKNQEVAIPTPTPKTRLSSTLSFHVPQQDLASLSMYSTTNLFGTWCAYLMNSIASISRTHCITAWSIFSHLRNNEWIPKVRGLARLNPHNYIWVVYPSPAIANKHQKGHVLWQDWITWVLKT